MITPVRRNAPPRMITSGQPIWPLSAPGMPVPKGYIYDFAELLGGAEMEIEGKTEKDKRVTQYGRNLSKVVRSLLYSNGDVPYKYVIRGHNEVTWKAIAGHRWTPRSAHEYGPRPSRVMIVGKMLGEDEYQHKRHFIGPSGQLLLDTCRDLGHKGMNQWYMTNVLKTPHPQGFGESTLKAEWVKQWMLILEQELRLVRPDFILLVGADAAKAVLGRQATIKSMEGRVVELPVNMNREVGERRAPHTALVMAINHPAQVLATPELHDKFKQHLSRFLQLTEGIRWDREESGLDHRVVRDIDSIRDLMAEIEADIDQNLLAFDAEWHGQHPQNKGSYLRTIQLSWRMKTAAAIVLRDEQGKSLYDDEEMEDIVEMLNDLVKGKRLAAHFGDADLEWLDYYGIKWKEVYHATPTCWEDFMDAWIGKQSCGFDTGLAAHALLETDDFSLTNQALNYTDAPRYDTRLIEWKKAYCNEHKMKDEELEGYGPCPDAILLGERDETHPTHHRYSYACYDADVVWRLALNQQRRLCRDSRDNNCWEPFWMSMRAQPAVLEINSTGVMLDKERTDQLTATYMQARDRLEAKIREWARWPDFNLNSVFAIREFLYGERLNGKVRKNPDDPPVRLRPPGARSLYLKPIISTDKRPMLWSRVIAEGLEDQKTPSTNKTALEILRQEAVEVRRKVRGQWRKFDLSDQVMWIRDYRFIGQVLKQSLRPPILDKDDESGDEYYRVGEDGHWVYAGGLASAVCSDGRVRTHIYPTKETGRWSSARPPLQNLSKRREVDYKRILGDDYQHPLRTLVCSSPGHVFVEADYVGAELFGMAIMSGDPTMLEHARRNQLPEDDPDFYDIHSNVAVLAFRLDCEPTKTGLASIGKSDLRICAKAVVFGIAYGRGAKAIALQCREEGVSITVEEAQQIIDTVFKLYPKLIPFFEECKRYALREQVLIGCFGRHRRFPKPFDFKTQGDFERQAQNFPIQGMIADAVARAVDHLYHYREEDARARYRIVLQVHDAIVLEVAHADVQYVVDQVMPECMVNRVPIYPCTLDGMPTGKGPYRLGIDVEVSHHWGAKMDPGEFLARKISPAAGGFKKGRHGWYKPGSPQKVWKQGGWVSIAG